MRSVRHGFPVLSAIPILILLAGTIGAAEAQDYPNRVIRLVTSEAGGGSDLAARILTPLLSANLGQPVVVENRGGGVIAGEVVAKAAPDGHTLLLMESSASIHKWLHKSVPYDVIADFTPIARVATSPLILFARDRKSTRLNSSH